MGLLVKSKTSAPNRKANIGATNPPSIRATTSTATGVKLLTEISLILFIEHREVGQGSAEAVQKKRLYCNASRPPAANLIFDINSSSVWDRGIDGPGILLWLKERP